MRVLCFLFLIVFAAAVGAFAYQNQQDVPVTFLKWGATGSVAVIAGVAYVLGMLSGWSVIGLLRRSFHRVTERPAHRDYAYR